MNQLVAAGISIVVIVLVMASYAYPHHFQNQTRVVTVWWNDAASECSSARRIWSVGQRFRSSVPETPHLPFCGAVRTDEGWFLLPDRATPNWFQEPRPELDARLQAGCRFEVTTVGPGEPKDEEGRLRFPLRHFITKIHQSLGCGYEVGPGSLSDS